MKLITAIIKPHRLEEVRDALSIENISGLTVTEVKGYGRQKGHAELYRGAEYVVAFVPKIKLEIVVEDSIANKAIDAVVASANTNSIGDGKIFVSNIEHAVRIRTGEINDLAL